MLPLDQCDMHLGQNLARCPKTVASAGPAPRHEFDEPVIAMLPRVLYVYWGFHSWWCSRQRGGLHGLLIWRFPQKGCP